MLFTFDFDVFLEFHIEPLPDGSVTYDEDTHTVTFHATHPDYCARIEIHDGHGWFVYYPCAPTHSGAIKVDDNENVEDMRVSMCLSVRPDVCSTPTKAEISECSWNTSVLRTPHV